MGDEEETTLAVADGGVFPLEPGRPVSFRLFLPAGGMRGVVEWIFDHGNRDLSRGCRSADLRQFDATILGLRISFCHGHSAARACLSL